WPLPRGHGHIRMNSGSTVDEPSRLVRFGRFELDRRTGELRKDGRKVRLQEQPVEVLDLLVTHAGDIVSREDICRRLWPDDTFVDFDTGLNNAISRLRAALGDKADQPRFIETVGRRGYRFIATVGPEPPASAPAESQPATPSEPARDPQPEP